MERVMGFSMNTFFCASRAEMAYGSWNSSETEMKTTSTLELLKISSGSVVAFEIWYFEAQCSAFLIGDACQSYSEIYSRIEEANLLRQITDGCDLVEV
jgi:hypothetical protein